jgi:hemin uptake protein HemP
MRRSGAARADLRWQERVTGDAGRTAPLRVNVALGGRYVFAGRDRRRQAPPWKRRSPDPQTRESIRCSQLIRLSTSDEEDRPASESASSRFARWLAWSASDAFAMRMSCLIATLNPMTEITNPARLIQSPTLIFTGSSALIIEGKGNVYFVQRRSLSSAMAPARQAGTSLLLIATERSTGGRQRERSRQRDRPCRPNGVHMRPPNGLPGLRCRADRDGPRRGTPRRPARQAPAICSISEMSSK